MNRLLRWRLRWNAAVAGALLCGACGAGDATLAGPGPDDETAHEAQRAAPPGTAVGRTATVGAGAAADAEPPAGPDAGLRQPVRTPRTQAAIDRLPVFARIDGEVPTAFVLRGELRPRRAREMEALARAVLADVSARLIGDREAPVAAPVDLCLFEDDASYTAFVDEAAGGDHSMLGFYLPSARLVVANLGRSVGNLRHEMVHPLIGDDFPRVPAWVNEGMGSLYGTARLRGGRFQFLVNYRLRHARKAQARGELPTLNDMAISTDRDVYGPEGMVYYGTARYVLLYLEASGALGAFYTALREGGPSAANQRALLARWMDDDRFGAWLGRLKIGRPPARLPARRR